MRLAERESQVVVHRIRGVVALQRAAQVAAEPGIGRYAHPELREATGQLEGAGTTQEAVRRPPRLEPEAVEGAVTGPDPDAVPGGLAHSYQHGDGRVSRPGGGAGVGERDVHRPEHAQAVQVPLRLVQ